MNGALVTAARVAFAIITLVAGGAHAQGAPPSRAASQPAEVVAESEDPATAPPAAPAGESAEGSLTLSAAELEELGFGATAEETLDTSLHVYGFADFTFSAPLMTKENGWRQLFNRYPTFWVGNFNVYLSRNLSESFRTLGEVRFTFLPNGTPLPPGSTGLVGDTQTIDYADFGRSMRWGGIEIERVYLEWSLHRFVTVRAGLFLTPYGIWNVDHGTPTYITTGKPYVIGNQLFPERQTGFELFGRWEASAYSVLGYHLTLSNGTGPVSEYRDLDDNKAVGARLYWQYRKLGDLKLGVSAYYGRDTSSEQTLGLNADGTRIAFDENLMFQSDALALAADAVWRYRRWHLQSEWISLQRRYTDEGRVQTTDIITGRTKYPIDTLSWGVYVLGAYRFEWYHIMPYIEVQYFDQLDPIAGLVTKVFGFGPGLNIRPTDAVVVKLAYTEGHFLGGHLVSADPLRLLQLQIAWAF